MPDLLRAAVEAHGGLLGSVVLVVHLRERVQGL
jgi:hypothetical protein